MKNKIKDKVSQCLHPSQLLSLQRGGWIAFRRWVNCCGNAYCIRKVSSGVELDALLYIVATPSTLDQQASHRVGNALPGCLWWWLRRATYEGRRSLSHPPCRAVYTPISITGLILMTCPWHVVGKHTSWHDLAVPGSRTSSSRETHPGVTVEGIKI